MNRKHGKKDQTRRHSSLRTSNSWLYLNVAVAFMLILAGVVFLFWMGQQSRQQQGSIAQAPLPQQGQRAPDFSLFSLSGEPVKLSDYSGQVVLINMWATWCPPCKAEMPTIDQYYQAHMDDGFVVLAVNSQEKADSVNSFIQNAGFTFPVLLDEQATVMDQYNVLGLPTSFIIGRDGTIQHTHTGQITKDQLKQYIDPLL
jgi:peroxiredoxin